MLLPSLTLLIRSVEARIAQLYSAGLRAEWSGVRVSSRQGLMIFLFTAASRPALGPFPWGWSGRGVKLTTHLHLVPKPSMRGAISPLPQYALMAWSSVKKKHRDNFTFNFNFTFTFNHKCSRGWFCNHLSQWLIILIYEYCSLSEVYLTLIQRFSFFGIWFYCLQMMMMMMMMIIIIIIIIIILRRADPPAKESYQMSLYVDREAH
jgi:hypothetical protein